MLDGFVFQRPLWLLALPVALALTWALLRRDDPRRAWAGVMDPHLLDALLIEGEQRRRLRPVHALGVLWVLMSIALAGPSWRIQPSPFAEDTAALIVVMEVSESMLAEDVQPSRIARAGQKVGDLIALRPDADVALVAYAGTAHRVLPLTPDGQAVALFAASLEPGLMPRPGDAAAAALALANAELERTGRAGSIVLLSDGIAPDQLERLSGHPSVPVHVLAVGRPAADPASLRELAARTGGSTVDVTPDEQDVEQLARSAERSMGRVASPGSAPSLYDDGYGLLPLIALLALLWSRAGWSLDVAEGRA